MDRRLRTARSSVWFAAPILLGVWAFSGCNSEGGSGDYSQEFEKPDVAASQPPEVANAKPQSRREMIEEDRAKPKSSKKGR